MLNPSQQKTELNATEAFQVSNLERGGLIVSWGGFRAQIAAYPETIKDSMGSPKGVPQVYILPERLFDIATGVSRSEIEFPIYFNFYIQNRKTTIICRRNQVKPVLRVLQESVFGPRALKLSRDYPKGRPTPDLGREMAYFKLDKERAGGRLRLRDIVDIRTFNSSQEAYHEGVTIKDLGLDRFAFVKGELTREVSLCELPRPNPVAPHSKRYRPPFFGVTMIGSGHGFDPSSDTSGFVIWVNGRGILVDPPVNTTRWMLKEGVDTRLIDDLILTHCHADHDAGTLQKLLEEGRVRLHTTPTVIDSFVRKYRGLLGLSTEQVHTLFDFSPITIGLPVNIAGAQFLFRYNFHPIPTLGFDVTFQGKTVAYSGDHLNDRSSLSELAQEGLLSPERLESLLDFRWESDLILHEAGIPPIHTPIEVLAELPDDVKDRLYIHHISLDKVPVDAGLKLAPTGVEATLTLDVSPPELWLAQRVLDLFAGVDLFTNTSILKTAEFLRIAHYRKFEAGEVLVKTHEAGDEFFVILSGEAEIIQGGEVLTKLGRYDYFGEVAVLLGSKRTADVVAFTDMEVLSVAAQDFLKFIWGSEMSRALHLVAESRLHEGWPLLNENQLLERLSVKQKTQLIPFLQQRTVPEGRLLFRRGDRIRCLYLIKEGQVKIQGETGIFTRAYRGNLVGRVRAEGDRHATTAITESQTVVYTISSQDLENFFLGNPGTYVRFLAAARGQTTEML